MEMHASSTIKCFLFKEDPCFFQDKRGFLHILTHSDTWAGFTPSLHIFSRDGSYGSWRVGTGYWGSPYTTNVSWLPPSDAVDEQPSVDTPPWTNFYRRERPELHLDADGAPEYLLNGVEFGLEAPAHQFSFTLLQRVNSTPTDAPRATPRFAAEVAEIEGLFGTELPQERRDELRAILGRSTKTIKTDDVSRPG